MKKKMSNPLIKRIPRELAGDWTKYLVVGLFLILMIGFVSGMYVANGSMSKAIQEGYVEYNLEDGHFELKQEASEELLTAIASGEMADVKAYYSQKAKKELEEKFQSEFDDSFEEEFNQQVRDTLTAQGMPEEVAEEMLPSAVKLIQGSDQYQSVYDSAYNSAYEEAETEIADQIDEKYAEAEEKYDLNDSDFTPSVVKLQAQFFRNEEEDHDSDGESDGTIRVYIRSEGVNQACLLEGAYPETKDEIAIDRMHADNADIHVGDTIKIGGEAYQVTGLIANVNYATLHEKNTDLMFDALQFDVGMMTEAGFDRLNTALHYAYAWSYKETPANETEEKNRSDQFLKALVTQCAVSETDIEDYLPAYENQAVHFAPEDIGGDKAMGGVLLDILIVVIAFIFAVTISNTIMKEASAIGTLRASGYTRGELVRHYLSMPVIVTLIGACIGNLLGYTVFKNVVVAMYYNSYSLPSYETVWNGTAFVKTTLIPLVIMIVVNLIIIVRMMQYSPLQFIRHDFKKKKRKKAMRLPGWKFFSRFRLRVMIQNIPNYLILFAGILLVSIMLAMAVGMPETLDFYKKNAENMMFAKYQYILKDYEVEDELVSTSAEDAEKFSMTSLDRKGSTKDEEVSVYGITEQSQYVQIEGLEQLKKSQVYISSSYQKKYGIQIGDSIQLDEKYESTQYQFTVAGIYDKCQTIAIFLPISNYNRIFDAKKDAFSGFFSNTELTDLGEDNIATVMTKRDITKMCDQLDHSMGSYMTYFQYLCILLSAVLIYLLTRIIIEKNENAISMTKILGYSNYEIASLYMLSTTIVLAAVDLISAVLGAAVMGVAWKAIMAGFSGYFEFILTPLGYGKIFSFILIGYLIVMFFDFIRIKKIPMEDALKNVE